MKIRLDDSVVEFNLYFAEDGAEQKLIDSKNELKISTVYDLKKVIEKKLNIPLQNQILLINGGINLEDKCLLSSYKNDRGEFTDSIFLFSNKFLKHALDESFHGTIPDYDPILKNANHILYPQDLKENHPLTSLAKKFYVHREHVKAILNASEKKLDWCNKMITEIHFQVTAFCCAYENLEGHSKHIFKTFNAFCEKFKKKREYFYKLLSNFKDDVNHLKKTALHQKLQTPTKKTIFDSLCDSEEKLLRYYKKCEESFKTLDAKVDEGRKSSEEIQKGVSTCLSDLTAPLPLNINFDVLRNKIREIEEIIKIQNSCLQEIEKDYKQIEALLSQTSCTKDVITTYNEKEVVTASFIQKNRDLDIKCKEIMKEFAHEKAKSTRHLFDSLRKISKVQVELKFLYRNIYAYDSSIKTLKGRFQAMEILSKISAATYLSYFEISRRIKYRKNLEKLVEEANLKFKQRFEEEYKHRQKFHDHVGKFIPPKLIPGFREDPPSVKVDFRISLDALLPSIDMTEDLDKSKLTDLYQNDFSEEDVMKMYADINENELFKRYNCSFSLKDEKFEEFNLSNSSDEELEKMNKSKMELLENQIKMLAEDKKKESILISSQELTQANETINKLKEQVESITRELEEEKLKSTKLEEEKNASILSKTGEHQSEIEGIKKEQELQLKQLEELMADEKKVIMELEEKLMKSEREREEMTTKMNLEMENLQNEKRVLEEKTLKSEEQLSKVMNELKNLKDENESLKKRCNSSNEESQQQIHKFKSEIDKLQKLIEEREELSKQINDKHEETLETMSQQFVLKLQEEKKKRKEAEKQLEDLIESKNQLFMENDNLKKANELPKKEILTLQEQVKILKKKNEDILKERNDFEKKLNENLSYYEIIFKEHQELSKTTELLKKEKITLENTIKEHQIEIENLSSTIKNQQSEIENLKYFAKMFQEFQDKCNLYEEQLKKTEKNLSETIKFRLQYEDTLKAIIKELRDLASVLGDSELYNNFNSILEKGTYESVLHHGLITKILEKLQSVL